ncbi:4-(cytidine 5'-diphospho)-2-C-methyl-D-erythritol kinase [Utexia brackfieldae]|uniref:4-(cytidine 5'-diphospho)-2-C-methyl-D-erythritol kinase n=1 Tax=Utexia brackfieldae TaxID=3074108 RepID=UPI00370D6D04
MICWPAPAKLNLFLYITGQRPADGYHNLQTLFQFLDYGDSLTFQLRQDDRIKLVNSISNVPDESNLIMIAAKLLRTVALQSGIPRDQMLGVDIGIDKTLPMGGGLGGASSDAATVLVALNQLWQLKLSTEQLIEISRQIGADVPIFIYGHSAFAQGIGDQLESIELPENYFLVVQPGIEISTAKIFNHPALIRDTPVRDLTTLLNSAFSNDCEPLVRYLYPEVDSVIKRMSAFAPTRLTGTGACVFAEFQDETSALAAKTALNLPNAFVAKGINRSPVYTNLIR